MSRARRLDGPLDVALESLRTHGLPYRWAERDLKVWFAACPVCRSGGWDLRIRESRRGGPVTLICANGCSDADVRENLAREPLEPRIEAALQLAEDARVLAAAAIDIVAVAVQREPIGSGATTPISVVANEAVARAPAGENHSHRHLLAAA